jgi:iron complex outermembrane receptor protein
MMGSTSQARNVNARIMGGELGAYKLDRTGRPTPPWPTPGARTAATAALPQMPPLDARLGLTYSATLERRRPVAWSRRRTASRTNKGNVVGKDFGKSAGFGVFSLNGAYRSATTSSSARASTTCSTRPTPST